VLRLIICLLVTVTSAQFTVAELRVMTVNTEWLWTPYDHHADGSKVTRKDMTKGEYAEEIRFYAQMIHKHDVDIVALSEIENVYVAKDLARALGKPWLSYFKQGRDTATGQDVAILSRLKLVPNSVSHYGFPCGRVAGAKKRKCLSKVLGAAFEYQGTRLSFVTSHFLSKRNESPSKNLKRQSQALALVHAAKQSQDSLHQKDQGRLVVLGDFNDTLKSKTMTLLMSGTDMESSRTCEYSDNEVERGRRWERRIDHILFKGFACREELQIPTGKYSDHDAFIAVLH
jgi:endonuclease/exonuclease/phosphatase family metal-dependent hydrolase